MEELLKYFPEWFKVLIVLIPVISILVASCAFILNLRQSFLNNKIARSKIIFDIFHSFMDDETIQKAFYKIEYDKFKYSSNFHGSDEEKEIDKLLRHYSNLALMWKSGILTLKDIYPIKYYVIRIKQNKDIYNYLEFMKNWTNRCGISNHPFLAIEELGKEIEKYAKKLKQKQ